MATTSLSGILNVRYEVQSGLLAATIRPTAGGAGKAVFMAGTHWGPLKTVWPFVPHCTGASPCGISVVAFPERAKAAYTVVPSLLTASARGLSPNTGIKLVTASVLVSTTAI